MAAKTHSPIMSSLRSLRGRLALSHLAVIFVAMTVAGFSMLSLVQGYFDQALEENLLAEAHLIIQALMPGATVAQPAPELNAAVNAVQQQQVENLAVELGKETFPPDPGRRQFYSESNLGHLGDATVGLTAALESRIRLLDSRGIVLIDSYAADVGVDYSNLEHVSEALRGQTGSMSQKIGEEEWLFVLVPFWVESQVAGVVFLGQPMRYISAVLSDLRVQLLIAVVLAMPFSALVGFLLARGIAKPVSALTAAAQKLAGGDFEHPLEATRDDELGRLSRAFEAMRDRLRRTDRMRTQFVSDVTHELRTPLTAIKGLAETLKDGAAEDPSVRDRFLDSIESETDRLIRLVNDLLILSRADSRALRLRRSRIDLHELAISVLEKLAPQAAADDISFELAFSKECLPVLADPDRLSQVLVNLIDNALKHSPPGGSVTLSGQRVLIVDGHLQASDGDGDMEIGPLLPAEGPRLPDGAWAVLSVADKGEGIPLDDLPHVFERFYRTDRSRSREKGGSGLGLSIAKALVQAHGGIIWLRSPVKRQDTPGPAGTIASFTIPLTD